MRPNIRIPSLALGLLLFVVVSQSSVGQQKAPAGQRGRAAHSDVWVQVDDGVQVARLFDLAQEPPSNEAQVAVLKLSDARYVEFKRDPIQFIDGYPIFKYAMNPRPEGCPKSGFEWKRTEGFPKGQGWIVPVGHWPDSCGSNSAFAPLTFPPIKPLNKPKPPKATPGVR